MKKTPRSIVDEIIKSLPIQVPFNTGGIIRYGKISENSPPDVKKWIKANGKNERAVRNRLNEIVRNRRETYQKHVDAGELPPVKNDEEAAFYPIPYSNPEELHPKTRESPQFISWQWRLYNNPLDAQAVAEVLKQKIKTIKRPRSINLIPDESTETTETSTAPQPATETTQAETTQATAQAPDMVSDIQLLPEADLLPYVISSEDDLAVDARPEYQTHEWVTVPHVVEPTELVLAGPRTLARDPRPQVNRSRVKAPKRNRWPKVAGLVAAVLFVAATYNVSFTEITQAIRKGTFFNTQPQKKTAGSPKEIMAEAWQQVYSDEFTYEKTQDLVLPLLDHPIHHWRAKALIALGYSLNIRGKHLLALEKLEEADAYLLKLSAPNDLAISRLAQVWSHYFLEDYLAAEEILRKTGLDHRHRIAAQLWFAKTAYARGDIEQAIRDAQDAYNAAKETKNLDMLADSANFLGQLLAINGDSGASFTYLTQGRQLVSQLGNDQKNTANLVGWYFWALANNMETIHIAKQLEFSEQFNARETFLLNRTIYDMYRRPHGNNQRVQPLPSLR